MLLINYLIIEDVSGVKINFFNNLPVGQVISNVSLPEDISTCPKKIGTISFKAVYVWKKIVKYTYFVAKTLNLHNTCILFRESSFCSRMLWFGDLINNFFRTDCAKIDFSIAMRFQSRIFW